MSVQPRELLNTSLDIYSKPQLLGYMLLPRSSTKQQISLQHREAAPGACHIGLPACSQDRQKPK